jgi:hypothetical protein
MTICSFHGNSEAIDLFVVVAAARVDVDHRRSHLAIDRISAVSRQRLRSLVWPGIAGNRWFLQLGAETAWAARVLRRALWEWGIEAEPFRFGHRIPLFKFRENPFCVVLIVSRADLMRTSADATHVSVKVVADDAIRKFPFPLMLRAPRRIERCIPKAGRRSFSPCVICAPPFCCATERTRQWEMSERIRFTRAPGMGAIISNLLKMMRVGITELGRSSFLE